MATISGKRFQITDGASTPTNLFPYTVTEAVYGLSTVIESAKNAVSSTLSAVTLNGTSKAGQTASFYAPATSGTTGQILKATTSGAPVWTSAALGASNKPIYLNSSGVLTEGVSCLPLSGGAGYPMTGNLYIESGGDAKLVLNNTDNETKYQYIAFRQNGTEYGKLGTFGTDDLKWGDSSVINTVYHSGNSNKSDVAWSCSTLTASGNATIAGNVGIGTTSPAYKLDVNGAAYATSLTLNGAITGATGLSFLTNANLVRLGAAGWYTVYTSLRNNVQADSVILHVDRAYSYANNESYTIAINGVYTGNIKFSQLNGAVNTQIITKVRVVYVNSGAYIIQIYYSTSSANDVRITGAGTGTFSAPTRNDSPTGTAVEFTLQTSGVATSGNIVASGAITAGSASDARLKTNINSMTSEDAIKLVMALRPVTFTWNDKATELYDQYKGNDLGFVAQEVETVLPGAIGTIFEKYKRLDQTKFIAPLVSVAQDHETRIERLERENRELRKEVERLRS